MALFFHSDDVDQLIPIQRSGADHRECSARYGFARGCQCAAQAAQSASQRRRRDIRHGAEYLRRRLGVAMARSARRWRCTEKRSPETRRSGRRSIPIKPNWR